MIFSDERPPGEEEIPRKRFVFQGAGTDLTYTVRVTLVLNGKAIATSQKTVKSLKSINSPQDKAENLVEDYD